MATFGIKVGIKNGAKTKLDAVSSSSNKTLEASLKQSNRKRFNGMLSNKKLSDIKSVNAKQVNGLAKKLSTVLLSLLTLGAPIALTSCGFQLRGYNSPMFYTTGGTFLSIDDDPTSFPLKRPLINKLEQVGVPVVDDIGRQINTSSELYTSSIKVDNIRFKRYELVGVLTEVKLVLSADVVYETLKNINGQTAEPIIVKNTIQVDRSYQFDEASVSIEDKQGQQVKDWLYDKLAQRIVDQYVALNLPRRAAS